MRRMTIFVDLIPLIWGLIMNQLPSVKKAQGEINGFSGNMDREQGEFMAKLPRDHPQLKGW